MISYKNSNLFEPQSLVMVEINGETKFLVRCTHCRMTKHEVKPSEAIVSYTRYARDPFMYQEIDLGFYLVSQLRSTSQYLVKDIVMDDIIYLNR